MTGGTNRGTVKGVNGGLRGPPPREPALSAHRNNSMVGSIAAPVPRAPNFSRSRRDRFLMFASDSPEAGPMHFQTRGAKSCLHVFIRPQATDPAPGSPA